MKFVQRLEKRIIYGVVLLLSLGWIWYSIIPNGIENRQIEAVQTGFVAPDFTLKTPAGAEFTLASLRGRVVLVNFWASWCPPCKAEMPALQKVYQAYKDEGFVILAVDSTSQDSIENVQKFVNENNINFPILLDQSGEVSNLYRIQSLPTSFFIGTDGVIREIVIGGPMAEALLFTRVEKLLKGAQ